MTWVKMHNRARNFIGEKVWVKALRRGFELPIRTAADHGEKTIFGALQPGKEFAFTEVKLSSCQTRICGHIPDRGWVNLASAFNAVGIYRPVWYIAWRAHGKLQRRPLGKGGTKEKACWHVASCDHAC